MSKKFDKENIARLAELSAIELSDIETEQVGEYLDDMRKLFSTLQRVNDDGVELAEREERSALLRLDEIKPSLTREELISLSKAQDGKYYKVKRVVE